MIALCFANWKAFAIAGAAVALALFVWRVGADGYERGYQARVAEETIAIREKTDAANRADADAARCAADPACRLSNDGWRRD